jgi:hypothetical protein
MYAKGADLLPAEVTAPLETTVVRPLAEAELRRALADAAAALRAELDRSEPALGGRLGPVLTELTPTPTTAS